MLSRVALLFVILIFFTAPCGATVITVRQDASGDFTTLTAAIAAAVAHDSISVGPGTYAETATLIVSLPLTIFSTDGRDVTLVDGQSIRRILEVSSMGVRLQGLSFVRGRGQGAPIAAAGAALFVSGSQVTMQDCLFRDNTGDWAGGIYVTDSSLGNSTSLTADDCVFEHNTTSQTAGAVYVVNGAKGNFSRCTFRDNSAGIKGGALHIIRAIGNFDHCLFQGNRSGDIAGAIFYESSSGETRSCTFNDHTSPGAFAGTILIQLSAGTNITRNVFAGDTDGAAIYYFEGTDAHSCNVFWNNADGAVGGDGLAADEVVADPLFCDAAMGDFTLSDNSPGAPAHSACGDAIGAFPVGCSLPLPGVPHIASIADVPGDNGRQVRIRWQRSSYDARNQPTTITGYGVYRREPANAAAAAVNLAANPGRAPEIALDGWDFVGTVPARGDDIYQFVAPTLCDARRNQEPCWSVFFVSAMTQDPLTFFDSAPDSGYSTDDIPPHAPAKLQRLLASAGVELRWEPNTDEGAVSYRIYRRTDPFGVSDGALVHTTVETSWVDASDVASEAAYRVTAVDDAGNEGPAASVTAPRSNRPKAYALHANEPNPFNPSTTIYYDVPEDGGRISLRIYDVEGRLVRTLVEGPESAGWRRSVTWNGARDDGGHVASGVYFCRLQATGFERSMRIVLIE